MTAPVAAVRRVVDTWRDSGSLWTASLLLDRLVPAGVLRLWPDVLVPEQALRAQVEAVFRAWGMAEDDVATTVRHVLYADLHAIDSHGCAMLRQYQRDLDVGLWSPLARVTVVHETEATALLDGGGGLGHVPADAAMRLAIAKCRTHGVAAVAVRGSGHFGAAGAYAELAADDGLVAIVTTGTRIPSVVPTGGVDARLGTNPIAVAAPAERNRPFLLDMATSTAPLGRLATAAHRGRAIPRGWALDPRGRSVTRARRAMAYRRLTPLGGEREAGGGHKGYGLATAVELLSAVLPGLAGAPCAPRETGGIGHFFLVLDPARFRADGGFARDVDALLDALRATQPRDPARPVRVAGDPEREAAAERRARGIPLARGVVEDVRSVARACGAPFLLEG